MRFAIPALSLLLLAGAARAADDLEAAKAGSGERFVESSGPGSPDGAVAAGQGSGHKADDAGAIADAVQGLKTSPPPGPAEVNALGKASSGMMGAGIGAVGGGLVGGVLGGPPGFYFGASLGALAGAFIGMLLGGKATQGDDAIRRRNKELEEAMK